MIDVKKPLRLVHLTQACSHKNNCSLVTTPDAEGSFFITWGNSATHPQYWRGNIDGSIYGHTAWRVENVPAEPVKRDYVVALIRHKEDVYPVAVVDDAALANHMAGHPGLVISKQNVTFFEHSFVPVERIPAMYRGAL